MYASRLKSIVKESADSSPIKIGIIYRNWDSAEQMNEYKVTQYEFPKVFQLDSTLQDYKLRYTCTPLSENETELEYYEWSESGNLHSPSMQEILEKLKKVMEESV